MDSNANHQKLGSPSRTLSWAWLRLGSRASGSLGGTRTRSWAGPGLGPGRGLDLGLGGASPLRARRGSPPRRSLRYRRCHPS